MKVLVLALGLVLFSSAIEASLVWHWSSQESSSLALPAQKQWITHFLLRLEQSSGPSAFQKRIEDLEDRFLQMDFQKLLVDWKQLEVDMKDSKPYPQMNQDFKRLYELRAYMNAQNDPDFRDFLEPLYFFSKDTSFRKKIRFDLSPLDSMTAQRLSEDFFVYGKKIKEIEVPYGSYFAQKWEFPYLLWGQIEVTEGQTLFRELKRKKIVELWTKKEISDLLKETRPKSLDALVVQIELDRHQTLKLGELRSTTEHSEFSKKISAKEDLSAWFHEDLNPRSERSWSLLKSPWFWLAVGAVAAGGAYWAYEANRGPMVIKTP